MGEFVFWTWTIKFHYSQKKTYFPQFLDNKQFFAMKIANHHDEQLTPLESWDQDGFVEPGFGVTSNSNHEARILQHFGHQIRVNTKTGS